jgi:hypothetical protein
LVILIFDSSFFNKRVKELKQQIYHKRTDPQTRTNWWYKQKKKIYHKKKSVKATNNSHDITELDEPSNFNTTVPALLQAPSPPLASYPMTR